jgi:hypothetical protein
MQNQPYVSTDTMHNENSVVPKCSHRRVRTCPAESKWAYTVKYLCGCHDEVRFFCCDLHHAMYQGVTVDNMPPYTDMKCRSCGGSLFVTEIKSTRL